jgi:hypothetical protein
MGLCRALCFQYKKAKLTAKVTMIVRVILRRLELVAVTDCVLTRARLTSA